MTETTASASGINSPSNQIEPAPVAEVLVGAFLGEGVVTDIVTSSNRSCPRHHTTRRTTETAGFRRR
jgi:hypothetical protein